MTVAFEPTVLKDFFFWRTAFYLKYQKCIYLMHLPECLKLLNSLTITQEKRDAIWQPHTVTASDAHLSITQLTDGPDDARGSAPGRRHRLRQPVAGLKYLSCCSGVKTLTHAAKQETGSQRASV